MATSSAMTYAQDKKINQQHWLMVIYVEKITAVAQRIQTCSDCIGRTGAS